MLDHDLTQTKSYTIGSQVIGITVDPNSTHDDHTIVYSTMEFDIRQLFIETEKTYRMINFGM